MVKNMINLLLLLKRMLVFEKDLGPDALHFEVT